MNNSRTNTIGKVAAQILIFYEDRNGIIGFAESQGFEAVKVSQLPSEQSTSFEIFI